MKISTTFTSSVHVSFGSSSNKNNSMYSNGRFKAQPLGFSKSSRLQSSSRNTSLDSCASKRYMSMYREASFLSSNQALTLAFLLFSGNHFQTLLRCVFLCYILFSQTIRFCGNKWNVDEIIESNHQVNCQYWLEMTLIKKENFEGKVITTALSPLYYAKLQAKLSEVAHHASQWYTSAT